MHTKPLPFIFLSTALLFFASCKKKDEIPAPQPIKVTYKTDGRIVKVSDVKPIAVDINGDQKVDYTVFLQLMANSTGDHLFAGINPIGLNLIKSGPEDENHFLNMGFLVEQKENTIIDQTLKTNQFWTDAHSILCIRHDNGNNPKTYEGAWGAGANHMVGFQLVLDGKSYFGWMRLQFNKTDETVTLVDYAYLTTPGAGIFAGER